MRTSDWSQMSSEFWLEFFFARIVKTSSSIDHVLKWTVSKNWMSNRSIIAPFSAIRRVIKPQSLYHTMKDVICLYQWQFCRIFYYANSRCWQRSESSQNTKTTSVTFLRKLVFFRHSSRWSLQKANVLTSS